VTSEAFAEAVRTGLTREPKAMDPRWLYDDRGSELFEQITELPEYYLTDRERSIFRTHAAEIASACPEPTRLIELGAGSAEKTRYILDALVDRQGSTTYAPVDVSPKALEMARRRLADEDQLEVHPIEASFEDGLAKLDPGTDEHRLVAFIGSSLGNMQPGDQRQLLRAVRGAMREDDRFLLGTDLVKDRDVLRQAYDDSQGVTAAFTLNLLRRINRELDADFDLDAFEHVVRFDEEKSAVESHLESQRDQTVAIPALDLEVTFAEGERMHVEDSYKYTETMLSDLFADVGLHRLERWTDDDEWFAVHLLSSSPAPL
jgi:L-histidine N-alpha-methyltransferase